MPPAAKSDREEAARFCRRVRRGSSAGIAVRVSAVVVPGVRRSFAALFAAAVPGRSPTSDEIAVRSSPSPADDTSSRCAETVSGTGPDTPADSSVLRTSAAFCAPGSAARDGSAANTATEACPTSAERVFAATANASPRDGFPTPPAERAACKPTLSARLFRKSSADDSPASDVSPGMATAEPGSGPAEAITFPSTRNSVVGRSRISPATSPINTTAAAAAIRSP